MNKTTLTIDVEYDPDVTDPESLASAMDILLETALSTPGILDEYGNPVVGGFSAPRPHEAYVVATQHNGISCSLDRFVSDTPIERERLTAYYETAEDFDWERDSIVIVDLNEPTDLDAWEADNDGEDDEDE